MASYRCYRCHRIIRVPSEHNIVCPFCDDGFIEMVNSRPSYDSLRRFSSSGAAVRTSRLRFRRSSRNQGGGRSSFNPVIVLRGPSADGGSGERSFELYYDDGAGSDLQPLPVAMSEFLIGSGSGFGFGFGFDRLLEQVETNGIGRNVDDHDQIQTAASKAAIESLPIVEIGDEHVSSESCCAVCKDAFEMGSSVREMPCKHIYHSDCILPWLSFRNSCPVCRRRIPTDSPHPPSAEREAIGLTIWRLPGGGFAVGRFHGGSRAGVRYREIPVVYTEMDGGISNNGGAPTRRRISPSREGGGFGRSIRNLFSSICRRLWSSNSSSTGSNGDSVNARLNPSGSVLNRQRRINRAMYVPSRPGSRLVVTTVPTTY